jgi:sugar lactone lactonase YvrE
MSADLSVVADYPLQVGENPLWHPREECLYWCGLYEGSLFRFDPATDRHERVFRGDPIGGFTFQSDGSVLLFQAEGAVRAWRDGEGIVETIVPPGGRVDARFNDVVADPRGRVFCGTYPQDDRTGALYRFDVAGTLTSQVVGVELSNGLGFSPDLTTLYYAESEAGTIYRFDYDADAGELRDRRVFVQLGDDEGLPDGLTVDADGDVWSAQAYGGCVVRYAPDGTERERLTMPTDFVSSVAFGGPDLRDLYVTTGGGDDREANGPEAGALFRCRPGPTGRAPCFSEIRPA